MIVKWLAVVVALTFAGFAPSPASAQAVPIPPFERAFVYNDGVYTTLYGPAPPGVYSTDAVGINASGQIAGNYTDRNGFTYGFLYNAGVYTTIDVPGSVYTEALGINSAGQVVGTYNNGVNNIGFLYSNGVYTTINPPASIGSVAVRINNSGDIVGDYTRQQNSQSGFLYTNGTYTTLSVPGEIVAVQGINDFGEIAGEYDDLSLNFHGFLYSNGSYVTVEPPNAAYSQALGINKSGQVVGFYAAAGVPPPPGESSTDYGFLYSNGVYTTLDVPDLSESSAMAINNYSQIVGNFAIGFADYGFLYSDGAYTTLDVQSQDNYPTSFTVALALNDSGQVVGFYGTSFASVPEPSTWAMLLLGFMGLGFVGYRTRSTA